MTNPSFRAAPHEARPLERLLMPWQVRTGNGDEPGHCAAVLGDEDFLSPRQGAASNDASSPSAEFGPTNTRIVPASARRRMSRP